MTTSADVDAHSRNTLCLHNRTYKNIETPKIITSRRVYSFTDPTQSGRKEDCWIFLNVVSTEFSTFLFTSLKSFHMFSKLHGNAQFFIWFPLTQLFQIIWFLARLQIIWEVYSLLNGKAYLIHKKHSTNIYLTMLQLSWLVVKRI